MFCSIVAYMCGASGILVCCDTVLPYETDDRLVCGVMHTAITGVSGVANMVWLLGECEGVYIFTRIK